MSEEVSEDISEEVSEEVLEPVITVFTLVLVIMEITEFMYILDTTDITATTGST